MRQGNERGGVRLRLIRVVPICIVKRLRSIPAIEEVLLSCLK